LLDKSRVTAGGGNQLRTEFLEADTTELELTPLGLDTDELADTGIGRTTRLGECASDCGLPAANPPGEQYPCREVAAQATKSTAGALRLGCALAATRPTPAVLREALSGDDRVQCVVTIGNHRFRKTTVEGEPLERRTLRRLHVRWRAPPTPDKEEGGDPARLMHQMYELGRGLIDSHSQFLSRLANDGLGQSFFVFKVTSGKMPAAVGEPGVLPQAE